MFRYIKTDLKVPTHTEPWLFITPHAPKLPKNCRECDKELAGESCAVYLKSGGYCERCYCFWYEYKNKRYTKDQAAARSVGMWPYGIHAGNIVFKMPSKNNKYKYGKYWHHHPSDWPEQTRRMLDADQILLDGVNWFPEEKIVMLESILN